MVENSLPLAPEPENQDEILFIRGLPYFAPKTAKKIALALDLGVTPQTLIKKCKGYKHPFCGIDVSDVVEHFINFYAAHIERARELFVEYSNADLDWEKW